jgi:hypothetical protein
MRAVADRQRHQLVPRRVELDLVDAVAEAVVAPELGKVAIGVARQLGDARARNGFAGLGQKSVGQAIFSRRAISVSRRSPVKALWPVSGVAWFITSCVA